MRERVDGNELRGVEERERERGDVAFFFFLKILLSGGEFALWIGLVKLMGLYGKRSSLPL